jgi:thymidine kinase
MSDEFPTPILPSKREKIRLELILGNMFAGKSSEGMRRATMRSFYQKVLLVNTVDDTRYSDTGIVTHDLRKMDAIRVKVLEELLSKEEYHNADAVIIDEGNFFPDISKFIRGQLKSTNKTFIVIGLNGDMNEKLFGKIHKLLPLADDITLLHAICKRCGDGTRATRTAPLIKFSGQKNVGGEGKYEAVCHDHYEIIQQEINILKSSIDGTTESN